MESLISQREVLYLWLPRPANRTKGHGLLADSSASTDTANAAAAGHTEASWIVVHS